MSGAEQRKAVRLAGRFDVQVREKLATWATSTEDVSHRGCRIAMTRPLRPGALVELAFDMGSQAEPLVVHGQVAWVRRAERAAGVTFLSAPRQRRDPAERPAPWFDRLHAARGRRERDPAPPGREAGPLLA